MNTALILIATGAQYHQYVRPLLESADKHFVPHETVLFTDSTEDFGVTKFWQRDLGYPLATLTRYHIFLKQKAYLEKFDYIFYSDIDMLFVGNVGHEIFADGITATLHAGYVNNNLINAPLERNPQSAAYLVQTNSYYCGGFNGGTRAAYFTMAENIRRDVEVDLHKGIVAVWHDESYLNKYLAVHPPAKILSPSYCYPETNLEYYKTIWKSDYVPRLLALTKEPREGVAQCNCPICHKKVFASLKALINEI